MLTFLLERRYTPKQNVLLRYNTSSAITQKDISFLPMEPVGCYCANIVTHIALLIEGRKVPQKSSPKTLRCVLPCLNTNAHLMTCRTDSPDGSPFGYSDTASGWFSNGIDAAASPLSLVRCFFSTVCP